MRIDDAWERLQKAYKEFIYHAEYFLKKDGSIVFLLKSKAAVAAIAANHKFKQKVLKKFKIGSEDFELVSFAMV